MEEINNLLEKYHNFRDAQIRSVQNLTETSKRLTIAIMDDDGEDTGSVTLEFDGITESRILDNSVLAFLDMMRGITLIKENDLYGFGLGQGSAMLQVHNAPMYIIASQMKIEEN